MSRQIHNSTLRRYTPLKRSSKPLKRTPIKKNKNKNNNKSSSQLKPGSKPIRQQTTKEASVKQLLSKLKAEIEIEALQDGTYYCQGCGGARCNNTGLDKCHILSVGQYKHLELVKENITLMGRKCHEIWDSGRLEEKKQLLNYEHMLSIALKYDELFYNRLSDNNSI